jgi:hypothetical protein
VDSHVCNNSFNMSIRGIVKRITNKPPKLVCYAHYHSLDPIWIHYNILWISILSTSACFWVILVGEPLSSIYSFPLCLIMHLDHALVGTSIGMSSESCSTSKNFPLIGFNKKFVDCSTLIGWSTSAFVLFLFF